MNQRNLMTPDLLADRWNVAVTTLSQWRWNGKGPKYLKLGGRILYRVQDIEEFEEQRVLSCTSQDLNLSAIY